MPLFWGPTNTEAETRVSALLEQLRRDLATLADPEHHVDDDPCGRGFYEGRVAAYRAEIRRLRDGRSVD